MNDNLIKKLDLKPYCDELSALYAREKDHIIKADINICKERIKELEKFSLIPPKQSINLDFALMHLLKSGILHLQTTYEFVKIINYFLYLKQVPFKEAMRTWLAKIIIPSNMQEVCSFYNDKGEIKEELDERLININQSLHLKKNQLFQEFRSLIRGGLLKDYLMDEQIHFVNDTECLLLRGGYKIKASIVGRSSSGGFYAVPASVEKTQNELSLLKSKKEEIFYEYAKRFSQVFTKELPFLRFINLSFDLFDALHARVLMAKKHDYEFIACSNTNKIKLTGFAHPILQNAKSINLDFSKKILLITGVNAGGKSMLLKGIMCACFMAKQLLPMRINAKESLISNYKEFDAILEDPQDVRNDISTFTGRMAHFATLFGKKRLLLGVDEIELGTDAAEAACLYSILINALSCQDIKIIITTHHKKLAMLLSKNKEVELLAALYDEANARPSFSFLAGTIGKSYAFESAARFINPIYIKKAKELYGKDNKDLEELLNKNIDLELLLRSKLENTSKKEAKLDALLESVKTQKEKDKASFLQSKMKLEDEYHHAIKAAKSAIKQKLVKDQHKSLNEANKLYKKISKEKVEEKQAFSVGDFVKYAKLKGEIIKLYKNEALIKTDNLTLRTPLSLLKPSQNPPKKKPSSINITKPAKLAVKLDLHGLRVEEALELTQTFLSDALLAGLDEVLIYHGIGTGALSRAIKELLLAHPRVKSFEDAPMNAGGFGAKIIRF